MELKKNIAYSGVLTLSLYLFQFVTYPYVARVLGVVNIGVCNFLQSIINYFMLFSMLGMSVLGVREIARSKENPDDLNKRFSGLLQLNLLITLFVLSIYGLSIILIPQFAEHKKLLYVGIAQILFNTLSVDWLFKGMEAFKYITCRRVVVQLLYVASVFLFVRCEDDTNIYFCILVGTYVLNGLINILHSRSLVCYSYQSWSYCFGNFMKPLCVLGFYSLLTSVYTGFNVVYLGMVSNAEQVGLFTTATKLQGIILALYASVTVAIMPRISSMLASGNITDVRSVIRKSVQVLLAFAFPVMIVGMGFSKEIVYLVAGSGYEAAAPLLSFAMLLILIIGLEQVFIVQVLLPAGKDKAVFIDSVMGALVGVAINVLLVQKWQSTGSVLAWGLAELVVLLFSIIFARRIVPIYNCMKDIVAYLAAFVPLAAIIAGLSYAEKDYLWTELIISIFITGLYFHCVVLCILKNSVYTKFCNDIKTKMMTRWKNG